MKRWFGIMLSAILIFWAGIEVCAADISFVPCENPNYTLTAFDGSTVSTKAAGKPKVLIFFKNECGNCRYMLKALKDSGKAYGNVDVIAAEFTGGTLEDTKTFCSAYVKEDITYCYNAGTAGWGYNVLLRPGNNSVTTPLVVYVSADNQIVQYSTGYDKDFLKHIEEYLSVTLSDQGSAPGDGTGDGSGSNPGQDTKPDDTSKPGQSDDLDDSARPEKGDEHTYKNVRYRVLTFNGSQGTAEVVSAENGSVKSVSIPDTVKIEGYTFRVVSVSDRAFEGCKRLTTAKIGKNVSSIGKKAFYGCTALTSVNIPSSVTKLEESVFSGCKKLKTVSGCGGITTVGSKAFYKCEKLVTVGSRSREVTLKKIRTIGSSAFYSCKAVKKVNLDSAALTKIDASAFQGCISMTSFTSGSKKLTTIGKNAFYGDKKLGTVSLKTEKLKKSKVGSNAFKGIKDSCKFKVPKKQVSAYRAMFKARGAGSKIKVSKL